MPAVDGRIHVTPSLVGFYTLAPLDGDGAARGFATAAANLADPAESAIRPASVTVAGAALRPPEGSRRGARREPWAALALAALALLLLEWWTYHRRLTV